MFPREGNAPSFRLARMEVVQGIRGKEHGVLAQMMLDGVAGRRGSRGDPELAVDRGQVPVDGARTDDQLFGDLGVGEPLGDETQHFDFTCGQARGIGG